MEINTCYISANNTYPQNTPNFIVVHNTDNFAPGANACAHASAQFHGNLTGMSAHYYVDDGDVVYQTANLDRGCWHVGVNYGGKLFGTVNNRNSIGIEMCVQKGYHFEKAFKNTIELIKNLMQLTGIKADCVVQHYDVCLKDCPSQIRRYGVWKQLQTEINIPSVSPFDTGLYRITADSLNIRSGPGTQYDIVGNISDKGTYTIVCIKNHHWGMLASGAGWISLNYARFVSDSNF